MRIKWFLKYKNVVRKIKFKCLSRLMCQQNIKKSTQIFKTWDKKANSKFLKQYMLKKKRKK